MEKTRLTNICQTCAECCKKFTFVELSEAEIHSLEQATGLHFDEFADKKGKTSAEGYFLKFQENGDCFFLEQDDKKYSCRVYHARPKICQDYPSKPEQIEYCHKNINNLD